MYNFIKKKERKEKEKKVYKKRKPFKLFSRHFPKKKKKSQEIYQKEIK
jgi:hypothetical protein